MIAILDASSVMNSQLLPNIISDMAIPQSVHAEIKSSQAKFILDTLSAKYKLSVLVPLSNYQEMVENTAQQMGQNRLSDPDKDVLALALMLAEHDDIMIYSDDYGLRNVAMQLKLPATGVTTKGGNQKRKYKYRCNGCGAIYKMKIVDCDICGHTEFQRLRR